MWEVPRAVHGVAVTGARARRVSERLTNGWQTFTVCGISSIYIYLAPPIWTSIAGTSHFGSTLFPKLPQPKVSYLVSALGHDQTWTSASTEAGLGRLRS